MEEQLSEQMRIEPQVLEGTHVMLEPVIAAHREPMRALLDCDPHIWEIYAASGYREHFPAFWDAMLNTENRMAFAIWDRSSGELAGTSSLFQIDPSHRSLEIGYTWLAPAHRGTCVNPEARLLMLRHAFGSGALRVQFTVDTRNARSRAAMAKFATQEGIIRRHRVTWTGHKRDSALFSVIDTEWPEVEETLQRRLRLAA
jgi:RimJ/RimL family protein N-acetyltransferase